MFQKFVFFILIISLHISYSSCFAHKTLLEKLEEDNASVTKLSRSLQEFKAKHQVYKLIGLHKQFLSPDLFPSANFDGISERTGMPKGPLQSDKMALGSFLFFNTAINDDHQILIKRCFDPLIQLYDNPDRSQWAEACDIVMHNIEQTVATNPYFRNRYTLFALAMASKFENKLAQLILVQSIHHIKLRKAAQKFIGVKKATLLEELKLAVNFPSFYGLLESQSTVEEIDPNCLPHSYVLRGRQKVLEKNIPEALLDFKRAEEMGDFEGCVEAVPFARNEDDRQRLIFKAFWMGNDSMYKELPLDKQHQYKAEHRLVDQLSVLMGSE